MPLVLQNSTLAGNTAIGQSAEGRQLDGFVVTFDRPVDPSEPGFDMQGRLLIGTDGGIYGGGGDDVLIGGRTTFDGTTDANDFVLGRKGGPLQTNIQPFDAQFRGGVSVAVGDVDGSGMVGGTQLGSVTDLIVDPFNRDENVELLIKVLNVVEQPDYETGLIYSGESGGINGDPVGGTGHFTQVIWADTRAIGQSNPPWGLDRIDQRRLPAGEGSVLDPSYDLLV